MGRKKTKYFAFYADDWLGGTYGMSHKAKGVFVDLLCLQFARGGVTESEVKNLAGDAWPEVENKFKLGGDGLYRNDRMIEEREIAMKRYKSKVDNSPFVDTTEYIPEGSTEGENKNKNKNKNKENKKREVEERVIPTFTDFESYAKSKKPDVNLESLKLKFDSWVENGWKDGFDKPIKNWKSKLLNTLPHLKESPKKGGGQVYDNYKDSSFN